MLFLDEKIKKKLPSKDVKLLLINNEKFYHYDYNYTIMIM